MAADPPGRCLEILSACSREELEADGWRRGGTCNGGHESRASLGGVRAPSPENIPSVIQLQLLSPADCSQSHIHPESVPTLDIKTACSGNIMNHDKSNGIAPDKARSCVICAQRKVRCDKEIPCSRCQRAGVQCIQPTTDQRPRWVRNIDARSSKSAQTASRTSTGAGVSADRVLVRLKHLEGLLKELNGEINDAHDSSTTTVGQHAESGVADLAGRVILDDSERARYVSNGFWSRIDSELDKLKEDVRGYGANDTLYGLIDHQPLSPASTGPDRSPHDRNAFLFKHNLKSPDYDIFKLHPMASQVPYLLEVYAERVHFVIGLPHLPTFKARLRQRQQREVSPEEEALVFSVYYATIGSLDEHEVSSGFNTSKEELLHQYRTGLEYALAQADFLSNPDECILQALNIFLALARRNESPKFVWMMTGLAIRMAHYLGMHRDGAESPHKTPFQVEMQRRLWSDMCALDLRVTEDQGTELAIPQGSYTTKHPSNINDTDIWPEMKHFPQERHEVTGVTLLRLCHETAHTMQDITAPGNRDSIEDHERRLDELRHKCDREYFSLTSESQHPTYKAMAGTMRVALARLTLLAYPSLLYSSPGEDLPLETRAKLLVAAMEVAEHNHALNADPSCQPWRWIYQTQQHWHAVIYILIEICRRPWSSTMERAWIALQSPWLVPIRARIDRDHNLWTPVRKLMERARKYRRTEISRLQNDPVAAAHAESDDRQQMPALSSTTTFPEYFDPETFRIQWRQLIRLGDVTASGAFNDGAAVLSDQMMTDPEIPPPSLAGTSTTFQDTPISQSGSQHFSTATPNDWNPPFSTDPWSRAQADTVDYPTLEAFLNTDMDMGFLDDIGVEEALNFDWNEWFESTKGVL